MKKIIKFFQTNQSISGYLSKATAFMVTPKMILNVHTFCLIKYKNRNITLKTEQTSTVYPKCDRWTSYDVSSHVRSK